MRMSDWSSDVCSSDLEARTSILPLENVPRALAARDTRGLIKLVADGPTRKLLGAHILAPEGADSIQTAAMAIRCGLTIDDLARSEERRVGKECVSTCRSRWSQDNSQNKALYNRTWRDNVPEMTTYARQKHILIKRVSTM